MHHDLTILFLLISASVAIAAEPENKETNVNATIDRGLVFLAKDALAWKKEHNCASCHHAALVVWSMREAKQRGHAVDEPVLAELTKWMAESGDGKTGVPRPPTAPKGLNSKALYFALALAADPDPDEVSQTGMKRFLKTIQEDQTENGSWSSWPDTRPPIFGYSDEIMTALATLALTSATAMSDDSTKPVRDKGIQWLAQTKSDEDPQSIAVRLMLGQRLGRPESELQPLMKTILERQNSDGGWSQSKEMTSDAWATGQALYALALAGKKADDPAIAQGRIFLIRTQKEDGSWPMTSRPTKPGGEGAMSLIPITGAGSAWGIIGLSRSS